MTGGWREWLGGFAVVGGMLLLMYCAIWVGARLARRAIRWLDEREARAEAERSG